MQDWKMQGWNLVDQIAGLENAGLENRLVGQQEGHLSSKNLNGGVLTWYLSGARCRFAYGPADFWLTRVVPDKGPLKGCCC